MISKKEEFTEALQKSRAMIVGVNGSQVILKGDDDVCSTLSCHEETRVVTEEGESRDLGQLLPGDIVKVETGEHGGQSAPSKIVVLRRAWREIESPEF